MNRGITSESLEILIDAMIHALTRDGLLHRSNPAVRTTIDPSIPSITIHFANFTTATFDLRTQKEIH